MKAKLISPMLIWTLILLANMLLIGCGEDNTKPAEEGADVATKVLADVTAKVAVSAKNTIASSDPNESGFNLQQVQKDYGQTPLTVLDVSERSKDGRNSIAITLSVPLDPSKNHQQYFNISAAGKGAIDGAWVISTSGKTIWFPYVDPDTSYDITIYQGLVAANNKSLANTINKQVKTSSLTASINFDTTGAFLTQGLGNGLPVVSVNIDAVDVNFYQVNEKDRQHFLQEMSYKNYQWDMKRITQYSELVYSGRYDLDQPKNTRVKRSINIEGIAELADPGIYLAVMTQAGAYDNHQVMWFSVTDIGLHARFYNEQLDVYASSLKTGKAIAKVAVTLVNDKGHILQQGVTSPSGQASFSSNLTSASLIIAQNAQHFSIIELNKPALDLSDFDLGLRPYRAQELFIYTPRNLYRPGEFVDFNALLRNDDGKLTAKSILSAAIKSPAGTKIKTFKWQGDQHSYYHYQWQIPTSAQLGNWQLEVVNVNREIVTYDFKVEEFLPERLKITFNTKAPQERLLASKKTTTYVACFRRVFIWCTSGR
ncbi:MAG: MG2 domain-containing protein [Colwellia sp.]